MFCLHVVNILIIEIVSHARCFVMWYINVIFIKFIKFTTYETVLIQKFSTVFSFMRHEIDEIEIEIHEIGCDTYVDVLKNDVKGTETDI